MHKTHLSCVLFECECGVCFSCCWSMTKRIVSALAGSKCGQSSQPLRMPHVKKSTFVAIARSGVSALLDDVLQREPRGLPDRPDVGQGGLFAGHGRRPNGTRLEIRAASRRSLHLHQRRRAPPAARRIVAACRSNRVFETLSRSLIRSICIRISHPFSIQIQCINRRK